MENNNNNKNKKTVSKEEVIAKLKDDGDFDTLRLKIIRKLKDNEELRNNIISIVRQSTALNRVGAENMKPRQLCDTIYDEVGSKVMGHISDGLWEIIRSGDGMKKEITETVQSVYNKLVEPDKKEEGESYTHHAMQLQNKADNKGTVDTTTGAADGNLSDSEPIEPPGFSLSNNHRNNHAQKELQLPMPCEDLGEEQREWPSRSNDVLEADDVDLGVPPGFSEDAEHKQPRDGSDEDPDVPPGFG